MRDGYPRPQFERAEYRSLNGEWNYSLPDGECGKIVVPYVCQSKASGIGKPLPGGEITCERTFSVPESWSGNRIVLHFGAVDYRADVYVNGKHAVSHGGGQSPFSADITDLLHASGEQSLRVEISDDPYEQRIPRGKQYWKDAGDWIFYTPSTGIWQEVWMEPVPVNALQLLRMTADTDRGCVRIEAEVGRKCKLPCKVTFFVTREGEPIADAAVTMRTRRTSVELELFHGDVKAGTHFDNGLCWSPENPVLFGLTAELDAGAGVCDRVESYFGMRKLSCVNGKLYLNNHPYEQRLVLDQGYWPDGLLTPPGPDAFRTDIEKAKQLGFNGCRKHEKAEDPRFLYWADKLGFLVWGATSSFYSYDETAADCHLAEWKALLQRDYNHPSIVCWDMLNESWGVPAIRGDKRQQAYADALYALAHAMDGTRPVISNDGWEMTHTDICALHSYQHGGNKDHAKRARFAETLKDLGTLSASALLEHHEAFAEGYAYAGQPVFLSEFGGTSFDFGGGWGYQAIHTEEEFLEDYDKLIGIIADSGLFCGYCYTQLTDVEQEKNGLMDADRNFKVDPEKFRALMEKHPCIVRK
ncbi:MAG: glycoside hydrolase family 2 TIM barrel-domain containing protein [Clostridia bacterium]|nr:glycoside hydrolase family 2 TIM barrel-domain containing protein [Clostridia bacterium]